MSAVDPQALGEALLAVWAQAKDNHERYSATGSEEDDIRFFALGIGGEAGEVVEALLETLFIAAAAGRLSNLVKKRWRDGDAHAEAIRFEVADVLAYAFMLADRLGLGPEDLIALVAEKQRVFVDKMRARAR